MYIKFYLSLNKMENDNTYGFHCGLCHKVILAPSYWRAYNSKQCCGIFYIHWAHCPDCSTEYIDKVSDWPPEIQMRCLWCGKGPLKDYE
jgi:hypothetical protein